MNIPYGSRNITDGKFCGNKDILKYLEWGTKITHLNAKWMENSPYPS